MGKARLLNQHFRWFFLLSAFIYIPNLTAKAFSGFGIDIDAYISESAHRYQLNEEMLRGLVKMEDGWYGKISPTGAVGVGQFTVSTWNALAATEDGQLIGMQPVTSKNRGKWNDPRHNQRINTLAIGLYANWHMKQFAEKGMIASDENLYLAHNIGLGGLHRAILGRSTKEDIKNMRHNGMKNGMTVKEFIAIQKKRYIQHKYEANFTSFKRPIRDMPETGNTFWIFPKQNTISWIQPQNTALTWITPK